MIRPTARSDAGMTLVELMVALTILGVVVTTSLAFMASQNTAFQASLNRLVALRNLRYAVSTLAQDLETLGTNVPEGQPTLVYADGDVIAFAADYATNLSGDPFAVFHDPDAPNGQVSAPGGGFSIPNATVSFPDTVYEAVPGVRSPAEVLVFFVAEDTSTARTDDFRLYRQVNDGAPELVARNLLRVGTRPFFSYERLADDGAGALALTEVPDSLVPLQHVAPAHLSTADTGRSALSDSVRAVRLDLGATNGLSGENEITVEISRLVPLPNAGFGELTTCGSAPILGVGLSASQGTLPSGDPATDLTWSPAVDEAGGETDVVRYVIWRRTAGSADWSDPFVAIPAGATSYTYQDAAVTVGDSYEYALAAQDCTPTLSGLEPSTAVTITP